MKTIIFDLDDTLIHTSYFYGLAVQEYSEVIERQDLDPEAAIRTLWEIDNAKISKIGFAATRFPSSMQEAYDDRCEAEGVRPSVRTRNELGNIGRKAVHHPVVFIDGALETLATLKSQFQYVLATRGDAIIQQQKIDSSDLKEFFPQENIHILHNKGPDEYQRILDFHNLVREHTWIVGDSIRSEINPALQLRLRCVHIPYQNLLDFKWPYDQMQPISEDFDRLTSIAELPVFLSENTM
jgi:putative hydrolase of the HAD superfamily